MASIERLPNELLTQICSMIQPGDIDDFSSCSRHIFDATNQVRQLHLHRKRAFTTICCYISYDGIRPFSLSSLLRDLICYPDIGWYPKYLFIRHRSFNKEKMLKDQSVGDLINSLKEQTVALTPTYPFIKRRISEIENSYGDFDLNTNIGGLIEALLLLKLPNLQSLEVTSICTSSFVEALASIAELWLNPGGEIKLPLQKLRYVHFNLRSWYFTDNSFEIFFYLAILPTVESFKIIGARSISYIAWKYPSKTSNVTEIDIEDSEITTKSLKGLLRGMEQLRIFRYGKSRPTRSLPPDFIIKALSMYNSKTLAQLSLSYPHVHGTLLTGEMTNLQCLKLLELTFVVIRSTGLPSFDKKIEDLLPSSLERLVVGRCAWPEPLIGFCKRLPSKKEEMLPCLEEILLEEKIKLDSKVVEACRQAGVTVKSSGDVEQTARKPILQGL